MKRNYVVWPLLIMLAGIFTLLLTQSSSAQGPAPIPTVIDTPMTFGPMFQAQGVATPIATALIEPATYDGDQFHVRALDVADYEQQVIVLINLERSRNGLPPVVRNGYLTIAAQGHTDDMAANNYVEHYGSNGSSPWSRIPAAGYTGSLGGEDVAAGQPDPASVVQAWLNSPGHRAIINGQYGEVGLGFTRKDGTNWVYFWTADFGGSPGKTTPGSGGGVQPGFTPVLPPTATQPAYYYPTPIPTLPYTIPPWFWATQTALARPVATATSYYNPPATVTPQPVGNGWQIVIWCEAPGNVGCRVVSSGPR